jgi:Fe-Mn family superoxide dismutase
MNDKLNPLAGLDLVKIVKRSVEAASPARLDESYVAEPKTYKQVSELVSEKTKNSHMELYKQHVEALNKVSAELDTADRGAADPNHSAFRSLKLDETGNMNGVWLHELYFSNCFAPASEVYMDSKAFMRLQEVFGTFDDWQKDFMACAMSTDDGWAICGYNIFLKRYVNTFVNDNDENVMMGLYPLIVVDMHEHSFYKDYLTDRKSYLIAQMREFNWETIEQRFLKAEAVAQVIK